MAYYRRRYYKKSSRDYAERHIREAKEFSKEIGGTDKDVKKYFFSLPQSELDLILSEYGTKYGSSAESYARKTFAKWKSRKTKMSGLVAKRLFNLLPPRMPLTKKYELAENVWKHFGPTSSATFVVGVDASVAAVAEKVAEKLDVMVTSYEIPEMVKNRFVWLAGGDITVQEKILNHLRGLQKDLARQRITQELPVLQRQMATHPDTTGRLCSILEIHKHKVSIHIEDKRKAVDATSTSKIKEIPSSSGYDKLPPSDSVESSGSWLWWGVAIVFLIFILTR